jgi:L-arabinose isomerase
MIDPGRHELWWVTGSQDLYGPDTLALVGNNAQQIGAHLDGADQLPLTVVTKPVVTSPAEIVDLCHQANANPRCAGLVLWMHTFSPARMWLRFLDEIHKPVLHLHTQFGRDLPWATIDMAYMNAHQAAHGDREFGYMAARTRSRAAVIAGHWEDQSVLDRIGVWARAAWAVADARGARIGRLGDNMREVAVTEGDKVEFQRVFGYEVNGYGVGELVERIDGVAPSDIDATVDAYLDSYDVMASLLPGGERHQSLRVAAGIEVGLRSFLADRDLVGFTDSFEDLYGIRQLPGIAAQRIMGDGYGFGAEGDWKTCAMVRAMKVMGHGLPGGTSFMEDYTYHLDPDGSFVLGAHMLEVCPTIAAKRPSCEIHPLSIGGADDPVRLVFNATAGPAVNMAVADMGERFRMTACAVDVVDPPEDLPNLPVARSLWRARPNLETAAEAWITAGGSHHSSHSAALTLDHITQYARMLGVELITIDHDCDLTALEKELRWNDAAYRLAAG